MPMRTGSHRHTPHTTSTRSLVPGARLRGSTRGPHCTRVAHALFGQTRAQRSGPCSPKAGGPTHRSSQGALGPGFPASGSSPDIEESAPKRGSRQGPRGHTCVSAKRLSALRLPRRRTSLGEWTRSHWKTDASESVSSLGEEEKQQVPRADRDEVVARSHLMLLRPAGPPGHEPRASLCTCTGTSVWARVPRTAGLRQRRRGHMLLR